MKPGVSSCRVALKTATGVKVDMTRKSSGETFAQVKAEKLPIRRVTSGGAAQATRICRPQQEGLTEALHVAHAR
jgi:ABC-type Fe3+ transport system substrate-binding protein